jgi:hypothetical protein
LGLLADDEDDDSDAIDDHVLSGPDQQQPEEQHGEQLPVNSVDYTMAGSSGEIFLRRSGMGTNDFRCQYCKIANLNFYADREWVRMILDANIAKSQI